MTKSDVYKCLREVIDPELNVNIVDLGLVYDVKIKNQNSKIKIIVVMTLTTPACPLAGSFEFLVKEELRALKGLNVDEDVKIELTFDPPWTQEMMSDELKAEFGFD